MKERTRIYLIERYNKILRKTTATCLKYYYICNGVNVNVYFDAYDKYSVA